MVFSKLNEPGVCHVGEMKAEHGLLLGFRPPFAGKKLRRFHLILEPPPPLSNPRVKLAVSHAPGPEKASIVTLLCDTLAEPRDLEVEAAATVHVTMPPVGGLLPVGVPLRV
ncbi:hypothetical protein PF010_g5615 [Phytophthora fragariae]|uniref:Uncharacterized protein n=2 Tax=Phytophthora fragariae TaxID=53985 RepID=A0A6G0S5U0_9STRA|nr:hypothetical protein PF010_g5615 [Phytophthora fragariae]KAE9350582.1 hypothetical protein PF008_g6357 [Phytophthora fragariae]